MKRKSDQTDRAALLRDIEEKTAATLKVITPLGFVMDTAEWLTIANYAKKYCTTTHVVTNWIRRGLIPEECVYTLSALNDLRMVKDQVYKNANLEVVG